MVENERIWDGTEDSASQKGVGHLEKVTWYWKKSCFIFFEGYCWWLKSGVKTSWGWWFSPLLTGFYTSFWSNYSDLTRPHPKLWLSKGHPLISGKSRLVKYYNSARSFGIFLPSTVSKGCWKTRGWQHRHHLLPTFEGANNFFFRMERARKWNGVHYKDLVTWENQP